MARKVKEATFEQVRSLAVILRIIKEQPTKAPRSKGDIATAMGVKASEITNEVKLIEKRGWATRRTGPIPRGVYYKLGAKGRQAIKAWDLLYG